MQKKHKEMWKTWVSYPYRLRVSVNDRKSQGNWEDFPLCFSDSFKHCLSGNSHFNSLIVVTDTLCIFLSVTINILMNFSGV